MLDGILDRLATYKEKMLAIKSKIKSALFYPISVVVVAVVVVWVIMVWVIPSFKKVFASFGADLPAPTLIVMAISEFVVSLVVADAVIIVGAVIDVRLAAPALGGVPLLGLDRISLKIPIIGADSRKGDDRPLDAHAADDVRRRRAAGRVARCGRRRLGQRRLRRRRPRSIQTEVSTGTSLTNSMANTQAASRRWCCR